MRTPNIVVVGGGLAGLMSSIRAVELGSRVTILSIVPPKRSHSACAQGGINAAMNTKGESDATWKHFEDTVYGGDFLANQKPVKNMCEEAPEIVYMFDRMGVMFNRTTEGLLDVRRAGGTKYSRVVFAGGTTGQQMLYALDEQVRRYEAEGKVKVLVGWHFLEAVIEEGRCYGVVAVDSRTMDIHNFPADAVIICTGGMGMIFGATTNGTLNTGSAVGALYQQGVHLGNPEMIQIHPTAIPGEDKNRLMSETCRGEGGRLWVYKEGKPWYFLEEKYPAYGNLVPRDIAAREIYKVCVEMGLGIDGENKVYLDLTHKKPRDLEIRLGGIIDIYQKFVGDDPGKVPMKIFPAMHYSMGGLWVEDDTQSTNFAGLFAAGECEYQYHGANRLGGNGMLSAVYGGMVAGRRVVEYVLSQSAADPAEGMYEAAKERIKKKFDRLGKMSGKENPYVLHRELCSVMSKNVTIVRYNNRLEETDAKIQELLERYNEIGMLDSSTWSNQAMLFTGDLYNMLQLSRAITLGALRRNESRGAHYKPEFPERDDKNWLRTTKAVYTPDGPRFSNDDVDISLIKPRPRSYQAVNTGDN